jgi:hypothetical protein
MSEKPKTAAKQSSAEAKPVAAKKPINKPPANPFLQKHPAPTNGRQKNSRKP